MTEKKLKIVHIGPVGSIGVQPTGTGGIEKAVYFIARYQAERGHVVSVIDIKVGVHQTLPPILKFFELWVPPLKDKGAVRHLIRVVFFCFGMVRVLHRLQAQKKVDIIHTHHQFPVAAARLAKTILRWKTPIVHTVHNPWILYTDFGHRLGNIFETSSLKRVAHVTMPTDFIRRELISRFGIKPENTSRVYYGINMEDINSFINEHASQPSVKTEKIVFCAARIQPRKNQMAVVRAVPAVLASCPEVQFIFSGPFDDPAYHQAMQSFVNENGLAGKVEFTGAVSQEVLYGLYIKAGIFVFPTLHEIQPVAIPEAMAFGLAVAASNIGPIADIVSQSPGSALLFNPDDTTEIVSVLSRLLTDDVLRRDIAAKGRKLAIDRFSWQGSAVEMLAVYERVLRL
jgi:glycosyltransferase involved in cell wall biosynthesis